MAEFLPQPCIGCLLDLAPFYLWAYNGDVEIVNFPQSAYNIVGASGECPHCLAKSYFHPVSGAHHEPVGSTSQQQIVSAAQCQACKGFLLIVGLKSGQNQPALLKRIYPLGKPNENVDVKYPPL